MKVRFEPSARDELDRIFAYIAQDSPGAAARVIERIERRVMGLADPGMARMGRRGYIAGAYELVQPPYIIVYRIDEARDEVIVVSVVHGARDR